MEVGVFKKFFADGLADSALEEDVVGHYHGSDAGGFQHGADVLQEIKLLVGAGCPKILAVVNEIVFFLFAFLVGEGHAAFFAERWIGQDAVEAFTVIGDQGIVGRDEAFAVNLADIVQKHVHQAEPPRVSDNLVTGKGFVLEEGFLWLVQLMV